MSLQFLSLFSLDALLESLKEMNLITVGVSILVCVLIFVVLMLINKKTGGLKWDTRKLTLGSICIALAYVLSFFKIIDLPQGGAVTVASMFPMLAYGYMAGPIWGTLAGLVYSLLQIIQGSYFLTPLQFAFDYILPFTLLGTLSGVFSTKYKNFNVYAGFALGVLARYICHFIAGFVFWGDAGSPLWANITYSLSYNSFVLIDAIPCFVLISIPAIKKLFKRATKKQIADN
ncbi:MAG: energy-coupled thiamine transporter ThiT [Clostridia bacterium]|nr:energy-coupled thiamine transporter ThiT [Clostridia bacterium]